MHQFYLPNESAAIEALQNEVKHLVNRVFYLHFAIFDMGISPFKNDQKMFNGLSEQTVIKQYELIKELEGELFAFYVDLQNQSMDRETSIQLKQLILSIRHVMMAAKGIRDINHNMETFRRSINDEFLGLTGIMKIQQESFTWNCLDYLFLRRAISFLKVWPI